MGPVIFLCRLEDLSDGDSRGFDPAQQGKDTILVIRKGKQLYAYRDVCPHYGDTPLPWRKDAYLNGDHSRIVCSAHGAQFDISTGACTLGPCLGQSLQSVRVVITDQQEVYVALKDI